MDSERSSVGREMTPMRTTTEEQADEWMLLPGLFSWDEIRALFAEGSGHDDGWRFLVRSAEIAGRPEPLYVVRAAQQRKSPEDRQG
jgi:hypothetical protein